MASLLARVARVNAHARPPRSHHVLLHPHATHPSVVGSPVSCRAHAWIASRALATSISSGSETTPRVTTLERSSDSSNGGPRFVRKGIDVAVRQKVLHIQKLARRKAFDVMLRVVFDRYKPLYDSHPALQGVRCLLLNKYVDTEAAIMEKKPRFVPSTYDDAVVRRLEIETVKEFLAVGRPDLVGAVYDHRQYMASSVGTVVDEKSGYVTDFSNHAKEFDLLALRAFDELHDKPKVVFVVVNAIKAGKTPSKLMLRLYLNALLEMDCDDEVRALFADIKERNWTVDVNFYREVLYFASMAHDGDLTQDVRSTMAKLGIPLRADDYLTAMRSFQDKVLDRTEGLVVPSNYRDCVNRIETRAVSPDAHDASKQILSLFDEMVDVAKLEPRHKMFFIFTIKAALLVQEYDRVPKYIELFERVFGEPIAGHQVLTSAVNALLLRDEAIAAWELVLKACNFDNQKRVSNEVLVSFTSILQYLGVHRDVKLMLQFLDVLKAKALLSQFKRDEHHGLIEAVVLDTTSVSDSIILEMLHQYPQAFRVADKTSSLETFAHTCMASGRWSLLGQVLKSRNLKRMPLIADFLAVRISASALDDKSSRQRMELVTAMARVVDFTSLSDTNRITLSGNAAQAAEALRALPE